MSALRLSLCSFISLYHVWYNLTVFIFSRISTLKRYLRRNRIQLFHGPSGIEKSIVLKKVWNEKIQALCVWISKILNQRLVGNQPKVKDSWSQVLLIDKTKMVLRKDRNIYVCRKPEERHNSEYDDMFPERSPRSSISDMFWGCSE